MEILLQGLYKASQDENEQVVKEVTGKRNWLNFLPLLYARFYTCKCILMVWFRYEQIWEGVWSPMLYIWV